MAIDVGDLTTEEMNDLLEKLLNHIQDYKVREIICETMGENELEELVIAAEDRIRAIQEEEAANEPDDD